MTDIWVSTIVMWVLVALAVGRQLDVGGRVVFAVALLLVACGSLVATNSFDPPSAYPLADHGWAVAATFAGILVCAGTLVREGLRRRSRRTDPPRIRQYRPLDWLTVLVLPVGGFVPVYGWLIALVLVWTSDAWTASEKRWATVGFPGGPIFAFVAAGAVLSGDWPFAAKLVVGSAVVLLGVMPAGAAIMLGRRLRREPADRLAAGAAY